MLLVDTLSSANDFGVDLAVALDPLVDLTVLTVKGSRLRAGDCARVIEAFPEYWGRSGRFAKLMDQLAAMLMLTREIWRHRHGAIHVQFFRVAWMEMPLYLLLRPLMARLIVTAHNALPHERRFWHKWTARVWYRRLDCIHVLSRHTGEILQSQFGVAAERILYAPHGCYARFLRDHPPAAAAGTRERLGVALGEHLVLYCGLMRPYKGVDRLIDAATRLATPGTRIHAAGRCAEPLLGELRDRLKKADLGERFRLVPQFVENQELSDLLAAADLVVFPYHHIYQSGAVLLAMTYGKAVLTSDLAGFREYVRHGESGWICDTTDPVAFGAAIDLLMRDEALRNRLSSAARLACETEFAWDQIAHAIAGAYAREPKQ
ncbi:MAG: glycosyltransferase family 4 protein [Burkholderiales bacterium]|nr:glycosyltransferase family 4 protein [Burkholderiales bacterium]